MLKNKKLSILVFSISGHTVRSDDTITHLTPNHNTTAATQVAYVTWTMYTRVTRYPIVVAIN